MICSIICDGFLFDFGVEGCGGLNGPEKRDSLKGEISNETKAWLFLASGGPVVILKSLSISLIRGHFVKG
jgi:hypothetical protein